MKVKSPIPLLKTISANYLARQFFNKGLRCYVEKIAKWSIYYSIPAMIRDFEAHSDDRTPKTDRLLTTVEFIFDPGPTRFNMKSDQSQAHYPFRTLPRELCEIIYTIVYQELMKVKKLERILIQEKLYENLIEEPLYLTANADIQIIYEHNRISNRLTVENLVYQKIKYSQVYQHKRHTSAFILLLTFEGYIPAKKLLEKYFEYREQLLSCANFLPFAIACYNNNSMLLRWLYEMTPESLRTKVRTFLCKGNVRFGALEDSLVNILVRRDQLEILDTITEIISTEQQEGPKVLLLSASLQSRRIFVRFWENCSADKKEVIISHALERETNYFAEARLDVKIFIWEHASEEQQKIILKNYYHKILFDCCLHGNAKFFDGIWKRLTKNLQRQFAQHFPEATSIAAQHCHLPILNSILSKVGQIEKTNAGFIPRSVYHYFYNPVYDIINKILYSDHAKIVRNTTPEIIKWYLDLARSLGLRSVDLAMIICSDATIGHEKSLDMVMLYPDVFGVTPDEMIFYALKATISRNNIEQAYRYLTALSESQKETFFKKFGTDVLTNCMTEKYYLITEFLIESASKSSQETLMNDDRIMSSFIWMTVEEKKLTFLIAYLWKKFSPLKQQQYFILLDEYIVDYIVKKLARYIDQRNHQEIVDDIFSLHPCIKQTYEEVQNQVVEGKICIIA